MFTLILLVFAFVLSCIAAFLAPDPTPHYWRLIAMSLAFFFLACVMDSQFVASHLPH